jgi:hypothetical protein
LSRRAAKPVRPLRRDRDPSTTRAALRSLGWNEGAIAGMLAVAERREVTDEPLPDRFERLKKTLEKYQRRTAVIIAQLMATAPNFRAVNSALKDRMGRKDRDVFSEADYQEAVAVHAPSVRAEQLKQAAMIPNRGSAAG